MKNIYGYYKDEVLKRGIELPYIYYFNNKDFENLKVKKCKFHTDINTLEGFYYYYENKPLKDLLIFVHGMGAGHKSYLTEINEFAKAGYMVFTYNATGCVTSTGDSLISIAQSLKDLDYAIRYLKYNKEFSKYNHKYVCGHSFGGYAAFNINHFHEEIEKSIVLSSYISIEEGIYGFTKNLDINNLDEYQNECFEYEIDVNKEYILNAKDTILNGNCEYLIVHSIDDWLFPFERNAKILENELKANNVKFLYFENKGHNPNYTIDALNYMSKSFKNLNDTNFKKSLENKKKQNDFKNSIDWNLIVQQDENFWAQVINFLT